MPDVHLSSSFAGDNTSDQNENDTFLSRIFGFHSIYNQLDNYQYYDPESQVGDSMVRRDTASNNLLDSESDSDLSSIESSSSSHSQPPSIHANDIQMQPYEPPTQLEDSKPQSLQSPQSSQRAPDPGPSHGILNNGTVSTEDARVQFRKTKTLPSFHTMYQRQARGRVFIPSRERALYLWANIVNMDEFLSDLYYYYRGRGIMNIVLGRIVDLATLVFVIGFASFLAWGVDYDKFLSRGSKNLTLSDLIIPHYISKAPAMAKLLLFGFAIYIILRIVQLYFDFRYKLSEIRNFYRQLLDIPHDDELMTISWATIVERLMELKDFNTLTSSSHYANDLKSKVRLNAHDIANRIMRKENYIIALINKDTLNLGFEIPVLSVLNPILSTRAVLTRTLEWNLKLCIYNFVFNNQGQVNPNVLKDYNRNMLAKELSSRFKMAAIINLLLCPFIVVYFVLLYFFRYFNEYKTNPSSLIGLRQYTPWAEWKLREFNELPHFFVKRLQLSIGPANTYINQFPRGFLVVNIMTLVNFVAGAITAVLVVMGLWFEDEEHSFWAFELTENKSALFYISIFGTIWAVTAGSLATDTSSTETANSSSPFYYDPEASLRYVTQFTHYMPSTWNKKLHTAEVKSEFCELFSLKIVVIINELLSLVLTPFILWFKLSSQSGAIIDFVREYSVYVDGLGYVCYFAMFNFEKKDKNMMHDLNKKKKKNPSRRTKGDDIEEEDESDHGVPNGDDKMIKSYMYFLESYDDRERAARPAPKSRQPPRTRLPPGSISESTYNVDHILEEDESTHGKSAGVFGMINQFYKQDLGR
ncbi:Autophagy-related protein [Meyerozyma sp. JA9]|nr:Autophagy-related protein [Meyerozyma sp. JA9]